MRGLASSQKESLSEDQIDRFVTLSARRDRLRHQISTNENKYKGLLDKTRNPLKDEETRSISMEITDVIQFIQEIDREIEEIILEKRADLILEIKNLRQGQKALRGYGGGYGGKSARSPKFIDRQG